MGNSQSSTNDYYKSKVSVLESRVSDAKYEDVIQAVKLYDNFRKMPMARRANVDYEALKSQAQNLYSTLADKVADSPAETVVEHSKPVAERKGLISRMAGKARTYVIAGIAAAALAAGATAAYYPQISNYFKKPDTVNVEKAETPATVSATAHKTDAPAAPKAPARNSVEPEFNIFNWINSPATAPVKTAPVAPTAQTTAALTAPSVLLGIDWSSRISNPLEYNASTSPATTAPAPAPAPKQEKADKNLDNLRDAARRVKANEKARASVEQAPDFVPPPAYIRVQKAEAAPSAPAQPARNVPAYKLTPPTDSGNTTVKAIVNLEGYADAETIGGTGTGKVTVDLGKIGFNAYANGFTTSQKFDTSDVDGNGSRFWASAHGYAPVSPKLSLYGELGGGIENRIYDVHFDSGSDFSYGDSSSFVNAKLGLTEGQIHNEDFGVGASHSYLLAQFTKNWGKATGDVKDAGFGNDYDATRASIKGRLMVAPDFSVEAGCAMFAEKFAEFLEQNYWTAQTGVRWHAGKGDGFVELLALYQDMESTVVGNESEDKRIGPQVGAGWRVFSGDNVTVDTTASAGYLFSQEAENEWFANWGLTFYFGKKGK